jgi:hypothetical protein
VFSSQADDLSSKESYSLINKDLGNIYYKDGQARTGLQYQEQTAEQMVEALRQADPPSC